MGLEKRITTAPMIGEGVEGGGDAMNRLNAVEGKTSSRSSEPFRAGSGPRFLSFEHVCAVVNEPEPSFSISNFTFEPVEPN